MKRINDFCTKWNPLLFLICAISCFVFENYGQGLVTLVLAWYALLVYGYKSKNIEP